MTEKEFISLFKESFDELESAICSETIYKDLSEWTSMQALFLIAHLDDETGIVLSAEDFIVTGSIAELYQLIMKRI